MTVRANPGDGRTGSRARRATRARRAAAVASVALGALALATVGPAGAERTQSGSVIASLDGGISPLALPRDRPAPVAVHLAGGLQTTDGKLLPRVTKIELGLPGQGEIDTRGLPVCPARKLRYATTAAAIDSCRSALVGRGSLEAQVHIPHQAPFTVNASLLAFNGRIDGRRAVILHAFASRPPTVVVLPFRLRLATGRFRTRLVAHLPAELGPWPHFAHFNLHFFRRYSYRGQPHSYLNSSCPIPPRLTAGFFSLAKARFYLANGRRIGVDITRSCRAR